MPTIKSKPQSFSNVVRFKQNSPSYCTGDLYQTEQSNFIEWTDYTEGVGNPRWKWLIKNGMDATTARTGVKSSYTSKGKFSAKYRYYDPCTDSYKDDGVDTIDGMPFYPSIPEVSWDGIENVVKRASLSFLNDIKNATRSVETGVILGELRQTVRLLRNPAWSLRQLIKYTMFTRYKKYRTIKKRDAAKVAADTWLEIQLGMKPLLADIQGILLAIERVSQKRETASVNGYAEEVVKTSSEVSGNYFQSGHVRTTGISERQNKVTCRFRGSVSLATDWEGSVLSNFGALPEDFIPTLWELVPWSFVIDYFINIGGWLNAASAATSRLTWSCSTTRAEASEVITAKAEKAPYPEVLSVRGDGNIKATKVVFNRGSVPAELPSFPEFRMPGIKQDFNILALMLSNQRMWPNLR